MLHMAFTRSMDFAIAGPTAKFTDITWRMKTKSFEMFFVAIKTLARRPDLRVCLEPGTTGTRRVVKLL